MKAHHSQFNMGLFVTFAVLLGAAVMVTSLMSEVNSDIYDNALGKTETFRVNNESLTWVNNTDNTLGSSGGAARITCLRVTNNRTGFPNATNDGILGNATVNSGNWTCSAGGFYISTSRDGGELFNLTAQLLITYDVVPLTAELNASRNGGEGFLSLAGQFDSMGTVLAVTFLIGMLLALGAAMFARG